MISGQRLKRDWRRGAWLSVFLVAGLAPQARAVEAPAPDATQLQAWVKQLGDEVFQKREEARAALLKAGASAVPLLRAARNDASAEVRNAVALILGQLQWQTLRPDINYLTLFPPDAVVALRVKNVLQSVAAAKQTATGKLADAAQFKPLRDLLDQQLEGNPALSPVLQWAGRFSGQIAGAVWGFDPRPPKQDLRFGLIAEITDADPEKVFQEFLAQAVPFTKGNVVQSNGLTIHKGPGDEGAVTLAGRHLIVGLNQESVEHLADGLLEPLPENVTTAPAYLRIKPGLGADPDLVLLFNMQSYVKLVTNLANPKMGELLNRMGYANFEMMGVSSSVAGAGFEDRIVLVVNDKPSKMLSLFANLDQSTATPQEALSVAPADAVAVANSYLDGAAAHDFVLDYAKSLFEAQGAMGVPGPAPNVDEFIAKFEATTGVKVADLLGAIKGDVVPWVKLAPGFGLPDFGFSIGCVDPAKAQFLAGALPKLVDSLPPMLMGNAPAAPPRPTIAKSQRLGHDFYTETEDSPLVVLPPRAPIPYRLTWAVHGSRLIVGSSAAVVEQRLAALDNKTPGFDLAKVLPPAPEAAAARQVGVFDLPAVLNYGARFGLPMLAGTLAQQPELQKAVLALAQQPEPFKTLSPMVSATGKGADGVHASVIWSPVPYLPTVIGGAVGTVAVFTMRAMPRPPAPPPIAAPPDQKF